MGESKKAYCFPVTPPSPMGRRWREASDEGFHALQYLANLTTLSRAYVCLNLSLREQIYQLRDLFLSIFHVIARNGGGEAVIYVVF